MISIEIPYDGAYESTLEAMIGYAEETMETTCSDYPALWLKIAKKWTSEMAHHLGVELEFEELNQPREYNFRDDMVFAKISEEDLFKLWDKANLDTVKEKYAERFEPRSGFIPFSKYLNFPHQPPEEWEAVQLYCIIDAILEDEPFEWEDVMREFIFNEVI